MITFYYQRSIEDAGRMLFSSSSRQTNNLYLVNTCLQLYKRKYIRPPFFYSFYAVAPFAHFAPVTPFAHFAPFAPFSLLLSIPLLLAL